MEGAWVMAGILPTAELRFESQRQHPISQVLLHRKNAHQATDNRQDGRRVTSLRRRRRGCQEQRWEARKADQSRVSGMSKAQVAMSSVSTSMLRRKEWWWRRVMVLVLKLGR